MYSRWDDEGQVHDYPSEHANGCTDDSESSLNILTKEAGHGQVGMGTKKNHADTTGVAELEESEEGGEYAIDCHSTDESSDAANDDEMEARFIAYYERGKDAQGMQVEAFDYRLARGSGADGGGQEDEETIGDNAGTVCGDWIWDGAFWNNADGVSYHPGLSQYFSHGKRIFLSDVDKPAPDEQKLKEEWKFKQYQVEYGTWATDWRHGTPTAAETQAAEKTKPQGSNAGPSRNRSHTHVIRHDSTIGRSKSCTLYIPRSDLSRLHARVCWDEGRAVFILSNCSRNSTYHNGKKVEGSGVHLAKGDIIFLGKSSSLTVKQLDIGGQATQPTLTLHHADRGLACKPEGSKSHDMKETFQTAVAVSFDGEPLEEEDDKEGGDGHESQSYRDRAAERRSLYAASESARRSDEYRSRQQQLQRKEAVSEDKARKLQQLEATINAIDAGCFRTLAEPQAEQMLAPPQPAPDPEWKERGAKMLKMMGWTEGQGLGRDSTGITLPLETRLQAGKSGLGLAAEMSGKVADKINSKLGRCEGKHTE